MRMILAATALLAAGAVHQAALAAAPNDIIWDPPKTGASAPSKETITPPASLQGAPGTPDKNGIIWDTPGAPSAAAPPSRPASPPPGAQPDSNGIVWNSAPVKPSSAPSGALLAPPPPGGRLAQAPVTDGQCREFQTTIIIEGKPQPAHGTVCQQADGTWRVVNK